MSFAAAHPSLQRALSERGYTTPTPVQAAVLAADAAGRDLLVSAQTGSGKTVAYGFALAASLLGDAARFARAAQPRALVVAPTRELALQIEEEIGWLFADTGARIVACVGGMDIRREQRELAKGAHVVVGTPGRLCDHLDRGRLVLGALDVVVLDEADEMLDLGFREDLERLLDGTPAQRRTLLLSATLPHAITALARRYQRDALRITMSPADEPHGDIEYRAMAIAPYDRDHAVVNALRFFDVRGALVFCATREAVRQLHGNLLERGFAVVALSGELSQPERARALQALRDGRARVCVATDVAARGLDLPDLGLVIHADLPRNREGLTHRSGRTGRAGRKGVSVLLVPHSQRRFADRLLASAKVRVLWSPPPTADAIRARDDERLGREIASLATDPSPDDVSAARAVIERHGPEQVATALVRLHRRLLPSPEELAPTPRPQPRALPGHAPASPRRRPHERASAPPSGREGAASPRTRPRDGAAAPPRRRAAHDVAAATAAPPQRRASRGDSVWFRMNVGRDANADPRWLLPLICRRGHVTKSEIGKIEIFDRETRFEVVPDAAERLALAVKRPDSKDGQIRIERVAERAAVDKVPNRRERRQAARAAASPARAT